MLIFPCIQFRKHPVSSHFFRSSFFRFNLFISLRFAPQNQVCKTRHFLFIFVSKIALLHGENWVLPPEKKNNNERTNAIFTKKKESIENINEH